MGMTLNLIDILLTTGRRFFEIGRYSDAITSLNKLANFRKLPEPILLEMQSLLADAHFEQGDYKEARRHLTAAIAIKPTHAEYHYLMAVAIEKDETADRERAEMYYQRAIKLDAAEAVYWLDYAGYLFSMEKRPQALKAARKALALAPRDAEILGPAADMLRENGYADDAAKALRDALFLSGGSSEFRSLWNLHQFKMIRLDQQPKQPARQQPERPVILPFTPRATQGTYKAIGGKTIRIDQAEGLPEPKEKKPTVFRRPPTKG